MSTVRCDTRLPEQSIHCVYRTCLECSYYTNDDFFCFHFHQTTVSEGKEEEKTHTGRYYNQTWRPNVFFLYYNTKYPVKGKRYEKYKTSIENDYLDSMTV